MESRVQEVHSDTYGLTADESLLDPLEICGGQAHLLLSAHLGVDDTSGDRDQAGVDLCGRRDSVVARLVR